MKNFKKLMALVIAMVMVVGSFNAFAADGDLTVDEKVTVTEFESGDTVTAYKFISWVDSVGWQIVSGLKKADGTTDFTVDDIADGLTKEELGALASAANVAKMTAVTGTTDGDEWTFTCGTMATAGSYLILVTSNNQEYVYNPAVVSADFSQTNEAAVELTEDSAAVKKQPITLDKEVVNKEDDYDVQVGDIVPFSVTVTVPQYNSNWINPYFAVSDELSTGLTLEVVPTIAGLTPGTDYTITEKGQKGDDGFTIQFTDTYLKSTPSAAVTITYSALVGEAVKDTAQVHEETNKVTLEFSNNPQDSSDHDEIDDETHHYTFAIDASRFGSSAGGTSTNELIKVGVDSRGNVINAVVKQEDESWSSGISPLAGAEFTLSGTGANNTGTYTATATSDENGRIFFNNLEEGTYTLTETKAPAGYMKDNTEHTVVIDATYADDGVLVSYKITIDDRETTHYTATTGSDSKTESITRDDSNEKTPIVNVKGVELPSTGGMGTTLFYVIGAILVLGAGILLVSKRRMSAN